MKTVLLSLAVAGALCAAASAAQRVYVLNGGGATGHAYKPHRIYVSGDGSFVITGMHWGSYSSRRATGAGTAHVDDCVPACADGTIYRVRVRVRLSAPKTCSNGRRYFLHERFTFVGHRPHWLRRRESYNAGGC